MRNTLLSFLFLLSGLGVQAQITITAATFPAAGDTLRFALVNGPGLPNIATPPGGNQFWDLSAISSDESFEWVYLPAVVGQNVNQFPGAELVVLGASGEQYYNVTSNKFELMGYTSNTLLNVPFDVLYKNNPPFVERYSPLNFFDIHQQSQSHLLPFAMADLPASLKDAILNAIPATPDSIRLRIATQTLAVVDAWGSLTIPGPAPNPPYTVLREKQTQYVERRIDAKINPLGWLDVTDVAITNNLGGGIDYFGVDTTSTYFFFNDAAKEEIAVVAVDINNLSSLSIRYKNNEPSGPLADKPVASEASIRAYPNPAAGWIILECAGLPADLYSLRFFDSSGSLVWSDTRWLAGEQSIRVDLKGLANGIYFYRLEDGKGRLLKADRLVIGRGE
ncbi:MAG: T9SS type A sorting domain-containing protein [Saprospirales bacterium]|nr:T9SS type A sorting domain-containing protein [Saprospirales bacterium]